MLTKTSEIGIQALVYLARAETVGPLSPRAVAKALGVSPTYLAKIMALFVKADILRAHRGVKGGVTLARASETIRLLDIVQVLQGIVHGRYCQGIAKTSEICAFHAAMLELHEATVAILGRWTLQDLVLRPFGAHSGLAPHTCLMGCLHGSESLNGITRGGL